MSKKVFHRYSEGLGYDLWTIFIKGVPDSLELALALSKTRDYFSGTNSAQVYLQITASATLDETTPYRIKFHDLLGNGQSSGRARQGAGTLLVNTAIQMLAEEYPSTSEVYGFLSPSGDPCEPELARLANEARRTFWTNFKFSIKDTQPDPLMRALLRDLVLIKKDRMVFNALPVFVPIERMDRIEGVSFSEYPTKNMPKYTSAGS